MECKLQVGQKVVCVDDDLDTYRVPGYTYAPSLVWPRLGQVYTVSWVGPWNHPDGTNNICVRLQELDMPWPCNANRFRGVKEESKGVTLFKAIAKGVTDGKPIVPDDEYMKRFKKVNH